MAERRVSTRFAVEGEAQYKSAIKNINSELKMLDSELKLANSSLKSNGASMDTLKAKQQALQNVISKLNEKISTSKAQMDKARQAQADWAAKAADARQRMEQLTSSTDDAGKETEEYKQKMAELQAEINRYEAAEAKAKSAVEAHAVEANNAASKLNTYESELRETGKALDEMSESADDSGKNMRNFGEKGAEAVNALAQTLLAAGVAKSFKEITEAIEECVKASVEYESAMAGVAKTTDLSGDDLKAMGETFKQMSTEMPIAATELARIAEVAGQLGVSSNNLESFTKVMAQLATATNMTSEEAATMIAQFAAITGMDLGNVDRLGAVIVALGNNFATNEQRITDMSQSIAGAATNAGMAETDMLALSTAVTSLGIEAGMGGTNMSKLISEMQNAVDTGKNLDVVAKAAGMTASEFSVLWGQDATAAIQAFVVGLGGMGSEMNGVLTTLGFGEQRFQRMITSLANAENSSGLLTRALELSNSAWKENTALVKEAETRYQTTESKISMFKSSVTNLGIAVGDQLTPALGNLAVTGKDVTNWATEFVEANSWLGPSIAAITSALGVLVTALVGVTTYANLIVPAIKGIKTAMTAASLATAGWTTLIVSVVAALAALIITADNSNNELAQTSELLKDIKESTRDYNNLVAEIDEEARATGGLVANLIALSEQENKTAAQKALLSSLVDELNTKIPELGLSYDSLNDKLNLTAEQIKAVAQEMARQAEMEAQVQRLSELYGEQAKLAEQLADAQEALAEAKARYVGAEIDETTGLYMLTGQIVGFGEDVYEAQAQVDNLTAALSNNGAAIDDLVGAYGEASDAQATLTDDENDLITYLDEATNRVQELLEKYREMGEAAIKGAEQTAGGLLNVVEVVESSSADVIAALQSQTEFFNQYAENIKAAAEHGLHEGLVAALSNGSLESAQILAGLASEGWANIDDLNAAFAATEEGKAALEANVREANATAEGELQAIADNVNAMVDELNKAGEASVAGIETINSYVAGLNSNLSGVSQAVNSINREIARITRSATATITIQTQRVTGSGHATGLSYVPYDEYPARLHEGELVLTKLQAEALRAQQRADAYSNDVRKIPASVQNTTVNDNRSSEIKIELNNATIRSEADISELAKELAAEIQKEKRRRGIT